MTKKKSMDMLHGPLGEKLMLLAVPIVLSCIFVLVKHFCNSTTYIFKNDIELHKESDNYCMNVACHGCTSHRQILQ